MTDRGQKNNNMQRDTDMGGVPRSVRIGPPLFKNRNRARRFEEKTFYKCIKLYYNFYDYYYKT